MTASRKAATLAICLAAALAGTWLASHCVVAISDSVPYRLFWRTSSGPEKAAKGDYVVFHLRDARIRNGKELTVVKELACGPGETIKIVDRDFFCGDTLLGRAKSVAKDGKKLDLAQVAGTIPADKFFAYGSHKDSFDSRYWGFLDRHSILFKALPIW